MNLLQRMGRGLEAGLLGGGGVAVLFFGTDVVGLAPLRTVSVLSRPFLGQAPDPESTGATLAALALGGAAILTYSLLHFATFGVLGIVATWVVPVASFWGTLARGALFGGVACSGAFAAGRYFAGASLAIESVGLVSVLLANVMAGTIMAAVFAVHADDEAPARAEAGRSTQRV